MAPDANDRGGSLGGGHQRSCALRAATAAQQRGSSRITLWCASMEFRLLVSVIWCTWGSLNCRSRPRIFWGLLECLTAASTSGADSARNCFHECGAAARDQWAAARSRHHEMVHAHAATKRGRPDAPRLPQRDAGRAPAHRRRAPADRRAGRGPGRRRRRAGGLRVPRTRVRRQRRRQGPRAGQPRAEPGRARRPGAARGPAGSIIARARADGVENCVPAARVGLRGCLWRGGRHGHIWVRPRRGRQDAGRRRLRDVGGAR